MLGRPKHGYYFVLESGGSMARKGREPAEAALLSTATYELSGPTPSAIALPEILSEDCEHDRRYGTVRNRDIHFVELGLA
jgi:hypothetical protein